MHPKTCWEALGIARLRTRRPVAIAVVTLLTACGAVPTREDPDAFFSVARGRVALRSTAVFADCVMDGFNKAHSLMANVSTRQQRRAKGLRVETFAGGRFPIASVDVLDDGEVELLEAKAAALINTQGEKDAFASCLARYGER